MDLINKQHMKEVVRAPGEESDDEDSNSELATEYVDSDISSSILAVTTPQFSFIFAAVATPKYQA